MVGVLCLQGEDGELLGCRVVLDSRGFRAELCSHPVFNGGFMAGPQLQTEPGSARPALE